MKSYKTDQERFWGGPFGSQYIDRNQGEKLLASNLSFFSKSLKSANSISSAIEYGANIGMNLKALQILYPNQSQTAVEINSIACEHLATSLPKCHIINTSILEFKPDNVYDLVLIKGVLIHINPNELPTVYDSLYNACRSYLLIAEYYSPTPVAIPYRGHSDRLFKRDFAGEMLDRYPNLTLLDYGFSYHRDPSFPQDDINWFLLSKLP